MDPNVRAGASLAMVVASLWLVTLWPLREDGVDMTAHKALRLEAEPLPLTGEPALMREPPPPARPTPGLPARSAVAIDPVLPEDDLEDSNPLIQLRGPVAERKLAYETEARDSAASEVESAIRTAFAQPDGSPELFRSVLCRESVCKVVLYWSQDRMDAYIAGVSRVAAGFDGEVAISPAGVTRADHIKPIEVYFKRLPRVAAD
jgi:hypothetical protein